MSSIAELSTEVLRRLPGLYRRWELIEIFEPYRNYQIEDAGAHADGTPLLAIYASDPVSGASAEIEHPPRPDGDRHAGRLRRFGERLSRS
ncbi:MAG: hypothetical protein ACK4NA_07170 [Alphaproteobacteria bacterium]